LLGGLARRATYLEQLRRERKNIILVDTGDLLYSRPPAPTPNAKKIGDLKADLYVKTYNLMGYDAFTPGELDFSFGVEPLVKMSKQAKFPFLVANLLDRKSNQPVFKSFLIKEVQGVKVGLLGLLSPRHPPGGPPEEKEKFYLADPIEAAKNLIPKMRKRCQVIAVLGHMDLDEQEMLIKAVPGIHFLLSGHALHYQLTPLRIHNSQIFMAGSRGENLGQGDFFMEGKNLHSRYQLVALTGKYADHTQIQELLDQYKNNLQRLLQSSLQAGPPRGPRRIAPPGASLPSMTYVGESACLSCHPQQHASWRETAHAKAYQTLVQKNRSADPTCLACHTTGFAQPQKGPHIRLENVQCEACHGPGDGHPNTRQSLLRVSEGQCLACHNATNSPDFHYDLYLQKVRH